MTEHDYITILDALAEAIAKQKTTIDLQAWEISELKSKLEAAEKEQGDKE